MAGENADNLKKRRTAIWFVCGVALALVVILLFAYTCTKGQFSAFLYRRTHSGRWLYSTLYHGVKSGDTLEQIERLLGPGKEVDSERQLRASRKFAQMNPGAHPDGYRDDDAFLGFPLSGGKIILQFRDGILVNFDPNEFTKYEPITTMM
jgi:hypothetical protein